MVLPAADLNITPELLLHGWYEAWLGHFLRHHLPIGGTFVDAGAHVGTFTVLGGTLVGPGGRVIAFEANTSNVEWLEQNLSMNYLNNVELRQAAAWSHATEVEFQAPARHTGIGWVGSEDDGVRVDSEFSTISITAQPLDSLEVDRIDVLKLDVEGGELEVLTGAQRLLEERRIGALVFEFRRYLAGADWEPLTELLAEQERRGATFHLPAWRGRLRRARSIRDIAAAGGGNNVAMLVSPQQ
jgi:FkbM family methyltransferase